MKRLALVLIPALVFGEAGVLVPTNSQQPDPAQLSLEEMEIAVRIDSGHATVSTKQIFANHTSSVMEGNYTFSLPGESAVSDFAIWDDVTRIPGVILERRRAEEIYNIAKQQAIDPGLLQMGERDMDEARRTSVFSAHIVPIPAMGTKRVELEYQQQLGVQQFKSSFSVPLRPDAYQAQTAGRLKISFELVSAHPFTAFNVTSKAYPLQIREKTTNLVKGDYEGRNVSLSEDLAIEYTLDRAKSDSLDVIAHRDNAQEPGYFRASALLGVGSGPAQDAPRTVIALFDTSLSMQWEKLERSFAGLERLLRGLRPADKFNLVLFNSETTIMEPAPVTAQPAAIDKALEFVRASRLRGGTDLKKALEAGLTQASAADSYLVLFTDGDITKGADLRNGKFETWYASQWKQSSAHPRTFVLAVGDDANINLLRALARQDGVVEWIRSTEPPDFKLDAFLSKIGVRPIQGLSLTSTAPVDLVYPLADTWFPGMEAAWVGQYSKPANSTFTASGQRGGSELMMKASVPLPAQELAHPELPRVWAKARVDALLEKIDRDGEDQATIDEIIRLARKYKFVTPYTSFLAAPRALLRPRLIRPGDPVLRIKTDASINSVVAIFPFGLVKKLRYLKDEDTWQTRFLAPVDLPDGTHEVRLVLRDRDGRVFREGKTFVILSKPPNVRVRLDKKQFRRGEAVFVRASASETARTVTARMYGVSPISLRWSQKAGANAGQFVIPDSLPAGRYSLTVTAEDFAHNIGSQEVPIEVLP